MSVHRAPTFPRFYVLSCLYDSAYPSSYNSTGFIESTTSWMSSLSNRNADNTRSVITRQIKEKRNKVKKGFKKCVYQYFIDNNINNNFNINIIAMAFNILTPTTVLTTTSSNFFYNNYGVKHFIILNGLILIKTAKNIVISINNNAFAHSLTSGIEPGGTEPGTAKYGNKEFAVNINLDKLVNIKNLTVNINLLNCHFNNNR